MDYIYKSMEIGPATYGGVRNVPIHHPPYKGTVNKGHRLYKNFDNKPK